LDLRAVVLDVGTELVVNAYIEECVSVDGFVSECNPSTTLMLAAACWLVVFCVGAGASIFLNVNAIVAAVGADNAND
jgi:hypothetical protein